MNLRLARIELGRHRAAWDVESPTRGVVLINVEVVGINERVPLHWRVGTWTKPPLDIHLDREGRFVGFQFVLQDERVPEGNSPDLPTPTVGLPIFDIQHWPSGRYLDRESHVAVNRLPGRELLLQLGDDRPTRHVCLLASGLAIGFASDGELNEIRLGPLPGENWDLIDAFAHPGS